MLLVGLVVGLLYNPISGAQTRRWLKEKLFGGGDFGFDQSGNGSGSAT